MLAHPLDTARLLLSPAARTRGAHPMLDAALCIVPCPVDDVPGRVSNGRGVSDRLVKAGRNAGALERVVRTKRGWSAWLMSWSGTSCLLDVPMHAAVRPHTGRRSRWPGRCSLTSGRLP